VLEWIKVVEFFITIVCDIFYFIFLRISFEHRVGCLSYTQSFIYFRYKVLYLNSSAHSSTKVSCSNNKAPSSSDRVFRPSDRTLRFNNTIPRSSYHL